jgi:hypothetical protein
VPVDRANAGELIRMAARATMTRMSFMIVFGKKSY